MGRVRSLGAHVQEREEVGWLSGSPACCSLKCLDLYFLLHLFDVWFSWRFLEDREILAWTVGMGKDIKNDRKMRGVVRC